VSGVQKNFGSLHFVMRVFSSEQLPLSLLNLPRKSVKEAINMSCITISSGVRLG